MTATTPERAAGGPVVTGCDQAMELSSETLDELFENSPAGAIPRGRGTGTALAAPATRLARPLARLGALVWRGKTFNPLSGELQNMLTLLEFRALRAEVHEGPSLVDGRPCIVCDYSRSSPLTCWIRDEIRQVGPADYLGLVFVRNHRIPLRFWLTFPQRA